MRPTPLLVAATLVGACNLVFDLEETSVESLRGGGAGTGGEGGTGGSAGMPGEAGAGGSEAGATSEAGAAGATGASGATGEAGAAGEAGATGAGGQGGGAGADVCGPTPSFEPPKVCGFSECDGITMTCPGTGGSCKFECQGSQSCDNSTIDCSLAKDCQLICSGDRACSGLRILCGSGSCEIICRGDSKACENMDDIDCEGTTACLLRCEAAMNSPPALSGCEGRPGDCCNSNCSP